ncbi:hypothetical protein TWF281_011493 [Arthrobotrys megalospora]
MPPRRRRVREQMNRFWSNTPNLDSFEISITDQKKRNHGFPLEVLPPRPSRSNLTSLGLNMMHFADYKYNTFLDLIHSVPSLKKLSMGNIDIYIENIDSPFESVSLSKDDEIPSHLFVDLPSVSWAGIFSTLIQKLPKLVEFTFEGLEYSISREPDCIRKIIPMALMKPSDDIMDPDMIFEEELVSPYQQDHLALARFKEEVDRRRAETGLRRLGYSTARNTTEQVHHLSWRFL